MAQILSHLSAFESFERVFSIFIVSILVGFCLNPRQSYNCKTVPILSIRSLRLKLLQILVSNFNLMRLYLHKQSHISNQFDKCAISFLFASA